MIELLYLNLNNHTKLDFEKNKQIQLLANNNNGKSSLYFLMKFIFGGKSKLLEKDTFFKKCFDRKIYLNLEWKIKLREKKYNIIYNTEKDNEIIINGETHNTKHYKELLNLGINIFGEKHSIYNVLFKENIIIDEIKNSTYMIKNRNQSYTSIFLLKLAYGDKILPYESYFANQGRIANIKNTKVKAKKELKSDIKDTIKKKYGDSVSEYALNLDDSYYSDFSEYSKLTRIKEKRYNENIVNEIKSLELVDDLEKVIEFHNKVVTDYNALIEDRRLQLENKLFSGSIKNTDNLIDNINLAVSAFTEKAYDDLLEKNFDFKSTLSKEEVLFFNKIVDEYRNSSRKINSKNQYFVNEIKEQRINKKSVSSLKIDISQIGNQGDGYIQINYLYNIFHFLSKSKFNFLLFDTKLYNEVDDKELNNFFSSIMKNYPKISFMILNHRARSVNNIHSIEISDELKIFGVDIK